MQEKNPAKMAREARHFVDEAFFVTCCANFGNSWFVTLSMKNHTSGKALLEDFDTLAARSVDHLFARLPPPGENYSNF